MMQPSHQSGHHRFGTTNKPNPLEKPRPQQAVVISTTDGRSPERSTDLSTISKEKLANPKILALRTELIHKYGSNRFVTIKAESELLDSKDVIVYLKTKELKNDLTYKIYLDDKYEVMIQLQKSNPLLEDKVFEGNNPPMTESKFNEYIQDETRRISN